jgi:guanine nucleotide-binding protein G(i) subunit alpha
MVSPPRYEEDPLGPSHNYSMACDMLSNSSEVKRVLATARQEKLSFADSAEYFFNSIPRILAGDYVPTTEDILRSRVKTTGIYKNKFTIDGMRISVYDTGGEISERKKWIHCFESTSAVFFVAALNGYHTMLDENHDIVCLSFFHFRSIPNTLNVVTKNTMKDSLVLWKSLVNSPWFKNSKFV